MLTDLEKIPHYSTLAAVYLLGVLLLLTPIMYLFVGRKFDKVFKNKLAEDLLSKLCPGIIILNEVTRLIIYANCIVFYKRIKNSTAKVSLDYNALFNGYDFHNNASSWQILLSNIYIYLGLAYATLAMLGTIPTWLYQAYNWLKICANHFFY